MTATNTPIKPTSGWRFYRKDITYSIMIIMMKKAIKKLSGPKNYRSRLPLFKSRANIVFVGSKKHGFAGQGKIRTSYFIPYFEFGARNYNVSTHFYRTPEHFVRNIDGYGEQPLAVIFIYNEERFDDYPSNDVIAALEARPKTIILNSPSSGRLVAFKSVTNKLLADRGVDVPELVVETGGRVFSNSAIGSQTETQVLDETCDIDASRYNTEFIDTRFDYMGDSYYVCLRALCVGPNLTELYIRCRSAREHSANVHSADTPLDAALLNEIYQQRVLPRYDELESICAEISKAIGYCFFAHDILLATDGRLPVCETGWKFDDGKLRDHLWPVSGDLNLMSGSYSGKAAEIAGIHIAKAINAYL